MGLIAKQFISLFHSEHAKNPQSALKLSVSYQEMNQKMILCLRRKEKGDLVRNKDSHSQSTPPLHHTITPSPDLASEGFMRKTRRGKMRHGLCSDPV